MFVSGGRARLFLSLSFLHSTSFSPSFSCIFFYILHFFPILFQVNQSAHTHTHTSIFSVLPRTVKTRVVLLFLIVDCLSRYCLFPFFYHDSFFSALLSIFSLSFSLLFLPRNCVCDWVHCSINGTVLQLKKDFCFISTIMIVLNVGQFLGCSIQAQ